MMISKQRERHTRFAHALVMPPLFLALTFENKFEKMKQRAKRRSVRFATQTSVYSDPVQNFRCLLSDYLKITKNKYFLYEHSEPEI